MRSERKAGPLVLAAMTFVALGCGDGATPFEPDRNPTLTFNPDTVTVAVGEYLILLVQGGPRNPRNPGVFTSDDEAVATVYEDLLCLPACGFVYVDPHAPGVATITGRYGSKTGTAVVTVVPR